MLDKIINILLYFGTIFLGAYGLWFTYHNEYSYLIAIATMTASLLMSIKVVSKDKILANILDLYSFCFAFVFLEKTITITNTDLKYFLISSIISLLSYVTYRFLSKTISSRIVAWVGSLAALGFGVKYLFKYIDKSFFIYFGGILALLVMHYCEVFYKGQDSAKDEGDMMDWVYGFILFFMMGFPLHTSWLLNGLFFSHAFLLFFLIAMIFIFNNYKVSYFLGSLILIALVINDIYILNEVKMEIVVLFTGIIITILGLIFKLMSRVPKTRNFLKSLAPQFLKSFRMEDNQLKREIFKIDNDLSMFNGLFKNK